MTTRTRWSDLPDIITPLDLMKILPIRRSNSKKYV